MYPLHHIREALMDVFQLLFEPQNQIIQTRQSCACKIGQDQTGQRLEQQFNQGLFACVLCHLVSFY